MAVPLWAWAAAALAVEPVDPFTEQDESELFRVEQRMVALTGRATQTVGDASHIVTILTDRELRERGYRDLSDALSAVPGIFVAESDGGRSLAWFRGFSGQRNNRFLLLIDGTPWRDGIDDHAFLDDYVPLADIKQIEVIRGPASAAYGAGALAGVVNVATYRAADLRGGFARGEAGSLGRHGLALVFGDRHPAGPADVEVAVYARYRAEQGEGQDDAEGGLRDVVGADPRRALGAGLLLGWRGLELRYDHVDYRHTVVGHERDDAVEVAEGGAPTRDWHDDYLAAHADLLLGGVGVITPTVYAQLHVDPGLTTLEGGEADGFDSAVVESVRRSSRYGALLDTELRPAFGHTTTLDAGFEALYVSAFEDRVFSDGAHLGFSDTRYATPVEQFDAHGRVQHRYAPLAWLEVEAAARYDLLQTTCIGVSDVCEAAESRWGVLSPRGAVILSLPGDVGMKLLFGRSFRSPTVEERIVEVASVSGSRAPAGVPGLSPEVLDGGDLELFWSPLSILDLRGAAFASVVRDDINLVPGSDGGGTWENGGGAVLAGADAGVVGRPGVFEAELSGSWTRVISAGSADFEFGAPELLGHARLQWRPADLLSLSALGDFIGARPGGGDTLDPAVGLLHLAVATDLFDDGRVRADLSVRNVLGTRYPLPPWPGTEYQPLADGRRVVVGVEFEL